MNVRSAIVLFLLVVSPVIVYLVWPSDESRIRKLINKEVKAAEEEDIEAFMSGISFNYQDERGLSYLLIRRLLQRELKTLSDIEVEREGLRIEVEGEGDRASAALDVRVIASEGEARGYYWGDIKEPVRLSLELRKEPAGRWLITGSSASHESHPTPRMH
jgi:hypothetical protein